MAGKLNIAFVTSEAVPFAKTGGLADVSGALPVNFKKLGHNCILIMPYYKMIKDKGFDADCSDMNINIKCGKGIVTYKVYTLLHNDVMCYFLHNSKYFDRDNLYGTPEGDYPDNAYRFGTFDMAVLELLKELNFKSDIIHINDWQTGLIPLYIKTIFKEDALFNKSKILFTIHNMAYQGLFNAEVLPDLSISWDVFQPYNGVEFFGKLSFLKTAIVFSNCISTVSKRYAEELKTEEYGCGLHDVLKKRGGDLYGILNGVDYAKWNPEVDTLIPEKYSIGNMHGKSKCKSGLQNKYKLPLEDKCPLIGMVSRLADQKGFDILSKAIQKLMKLEVQIVILGTGDAKYHKLLPELHERYKTKLGIRIDFDNKLAHEIEAGSDMFLMPSKYEPCGLNQIYSLKYGTIPIVRATGGLDDTIIDYNDDPKNGNGFKFQEYKSNALIKAVQNALNVYNNEEEWNNLVNKCMKMDFSWDRSADSYIKLYKKI